MDTLNQDDTPRKEIRLAVVLFGGSSLAVYMNGVVQELLKMVWATSPAADHLDLEPTEAVYQELGRTYGIRFVVDVLSGSSAGGINAIYLAKALVNRQDIEDLERMWINEADIDKLIFDHRSGEGLPADLRGVLNKKPKKSVFNGQRMYYLLLDAFHRMERTALRGRNGRPLPTSPSLVDELDLFVTATDLVGTCSPIRVSNAVFAERRHRKVFHFRYADPALIGERRDDFGPEADPFLAFAARCTSSLPLAFEPMTLDTIQEVLDTSSYPGDQTALEDAGQACARYFPDFVRKNASEAELQRFRARAFADGGYLDNKPFGFATSTLLTRWAHAPLDRKLVYVEPSPEAPVDRSKDATPDALENLMLALTTLPRTEPIADDIAFIKQQNQLIERFRCYQQYAIEALVPGFVSPQGADARLVFGQVWAKASSNVKWMNWGLALSVHHYGHTYYAYHHVRLTLTTDELARLVTQALPGTETGETVAAVRELVKAWRVTHYQTEGGPKTEDGPAGPGETENMFMYRADPGYRIRRLRFILQLIDTLEVLDRPHAEADGERALQPVRAIFQVANQPMPSSVAEQRQMVRELRQVRHELTTVLRKLLFYCRDLQLLDPKNNTVRFQEEEQAVLDRIRSELAAGTAPTLDQATLKKILDVTLDTTLAEAGRLAAVERIMPLEAPFFRYLEEVCAYLHAVLRAASAACKTALNDTSVVRSLLKFYYDHYDYFDVMTLPMIAGTAAGEADVIDIIRISPTDAAFRGFSEPHNRAPLKSAQYNSFGGFFSRGWRQEDLLWGRLDAADILIRSLKNDVRATLKAQAATEPDPDKLEQAVTNRLDEAVDKAQAAILRRRFLGYLPGLDTALTEAVNTVLKRVEKSNPPPAVPTETDIEARQAIAVPLLQRVLQEAYTDNLGMLRMFAQMLPFNPTLPTAPLLRIAGRTVHIIGRVLDDMSTKYAVLGKPAYWLIRLGLFVWGLVELALPDTLLGVLMRNWFGLVYLAEALVLALGYALARTELISIGWVTVLATLVTQGVVYLIEQWLRAKDGHPPTSGRQPRAG